MQNTDGVVLPDRVTTIRTVDINRSIAWIVDGFQLFMKKPGELIIVGVVLFLLSLVLYFIFLVGGALTTMIAVVATGALMRACQADESGQDPMVAAQQTASNGQLWMLGLIAAALGFAVTALNWVLLLTTIGAAFINPLIAMGLAGVTGLFMLLVSIPVMMTLWLAPGLVVLKGVPPLDAVRLSFVASLKNIWSFMIFYVVAAIACFISVMLAGIGLIVVYPVLLCATYLAYKDIFGAAAHGEAVAYLQDAP